MQNIIIMCQTILVCWSTSIAHTPHKNTKKYLKRRHVKIKMNTWQVPKWDCLQRIAGTPHPGSFYIPLLKVFSFLGSTWFWATGVVIANNPVYKECQSAIILKLGTNPLNIFSRSWHLFEAIRKESKLLWKGILFKNFFQLLLL